MKYLSSCGYNQIQRVYPNSSYFSFKFSQNRNFMMKELAQSRFFWCFPTCVTFETDILKDLLLRTKKHQDKQKCEEIYDQIFNWKSSTVLEKKIKYFWSDAP